MKAEAVRRYIVDNFPGTNAVAAAGDVYFVHDPDRDLPDIGWQPWATLVSSDAHDSASNLDRPGVFRLNIGLTKAGFRELFPAELERDPTALDVVLPHPVYAKQHWICVLNPATSWPTVCDLLHQAHSFATRKHTNAARRRGE